MPAAAVTTAAAASVIRLRLFIAPLSTKRIGGGGGLRRSLTLFDFGGEQITRLTRLMDGLTRAGDGDAKQPVFARSAAIAAVTSRFYPLCPFYYAKIAEILATHDQLFWPRL